MNIDEQLKIIKRGIVDVVNEAELVAKLKKGVPLRIKVGFDPTSPDLHLGHTVLMQKLKQFQELGHQVIFLIGDFTARIGDPSGRSVARPPLSPDEIAVNLKTYVDQAAKILDWDRVELRYNSEWLGTMSFVDVIKLASQYTVARMLEREDFKKRYTAGDPLGVHEFLYPLMQGYDSVALKADVELGGTDQIFNLLVGRDLQRAYSMEAQVVITMPLLVGTDGVQKMSKSYGNSIGISDTPRDMFGKVMSISDDLMWSYYEILSDLSLPEVAELKNSVLVGKVHPKVAKESLAMEMVERFYSESHAESAREEFERMFAKKGRPDVIEEVKIDCMEDGISLVDAIVIAKLCDSKSDARRMIEQRAVCLDEVKIEDIGYRLTPAKPVVVKVGKRRYAKLVF